MSQQKKKKENESDEKKNIKRLFGRLIQHF